ncbi:NAD-dependent epimerase/dehydratase family protein [Nonomuraea sp. MG754425]|uniref:NAD-dependent epimerase/dehydratase family protein n=1 Tax=Nonomuraea sp. MG754425 TaxID=2570319 RepID=UPI001F3532F9|nr:NAD-dependent epimerase/dehydratase family protein [Nonomuraea sp. MG754425]
MPPSIEGRGCAEKFKRVLITGGAGFLGSHIVLELVTAGAEVVCVDDFSTGQYANLAALVGHPRFTLIKADACGMGSLHIPCDLVLHLASPASPRDYTRLSLETLQVGSQGTFAALTLARRFRARFVLASTSEVYGDPLEHPQKEDYRGNVNSTGPRSMYDEAKRYAEALTSAFAARYDTDVAIARIFNTYGPRMRADDGRAIPEFIERALTNQPLRVHGDGGQTRSLCYVDDTVRGFLALAASSFSGPVNIGGTEEITLLGLAKIVIKLIGSKSAIQHVDAKHEDPRRRRPDISRAHGHLKWAPRITLRDGLMRTIDAARRLSSASTGAAAVRDPFPQP